MRKRTRSGVRAAVETLVAGLLLMPAGAQAEEPKPIEPAPVCVSLHGDRRPLGLAVAGQVAAFIPAALLTGRRRRGQPPGSAGHRPASYHLPESWVSGAVDRRCEATKSRRTGALALGWRS
jgi:hypothetical protein